MNWDRVADGMVRVRHSPKHRADVPVDQCSQTIERPGTSLRPAPCEGCAADYPGRHRAIEVSS